MDWNSPTTKKHIAEAEAQGCELICEGRDANFRTYLLPCGHEKEIGPGAMRVGNFRCQICLDNRIKDEAEAQGCVLLGPGRNAQYRTYRLSCGHEKEITTRDIRLGNFRCQVCLKGRWQVEAKEQGCKLISSGRTQSYRIYLLPCGHKQEVHIAQMRSGGFRCQTCLCKRFMEEAKERGCELLGPGRTRHHRVYRLACGHKQQVGLQNMRKGDFWCRTCLDNKLREEAEAQGCELLGSGKNANYRTYRLPCGHEREVGPGRIRDGNFRCQTCFDDKLKAEAAAQGCGLLGPGSNAHHRTYRLPCGHEQEVQVGKMRDGGFQCQTCLEIKWAEEAVAKGCVLLGLGQNHRYRIYLLPCGHEQEIYTPNMRSGGFRCQTCFEKTLKAEAKAQGCLILGAGKDNNSRTYRLECGHEQSIRLENIRDGNFRCQTCLEDKLQAEARAQGCEMLGFARHTSYRTYRLSCNHVQEVQVTHMRRDNFRCQVCEDWAFTQPSQAYLLHIRVGADEWLKLGFAKDIDLRVIQYKLPSEADVTTLATLPFDTGKEAQEFEQSLHKKHKRKRLRVKDMLSFHTGSGATECYPLTMVDNLMVAFRLPE